MKIQHIDKARYKRHMKRIMIGCVAFLAAVSLSVSTAMIALWGGPEGSNFWLNLIGVVIAAFMLGSLLRRYKHHDYFTECWYVWQLKAQINQIYRKLRELEQVAGVENRDGRPPLAPEKLNYTAHQALQILDWYYRACEQLYRLDDNTITLSELAAKAREITALSEQAQVNSPGDQCPPL